MLSLDREGEIEEGVKRERWREEEVDRREEREQEREEGIRRGILDQK